MFGRLDGFLRVDKRVLKREEKSTNICIWGFNRDIVECKGYYCHPYSSWERGFNRDIVECKDHWFNAVFERLTVLIET